MALARKNGTLTKEMLAKLAKLKGASKKASAAANAQRKKVKALNKKAKAAAAA